MMAISHCHCADGEVCSKCITFFSESYNTGIDFNAVSSSAYRFRWLWQRTPKTVWWAACKAKRQPYTWHNHHYHATGTGELILLDLLWPLLWRKDRRKFYLTTTTSVECRQLSSREVLLSWIRSIEVMSGLLVLLSLLLGQTQYTLCTLQLFLLKLRYWARVSIHCTLYSYPY